MKRKYVLSLAAAAIGSGMIAVAAVHAHGFGHHGHHGSGAARACIAVMTHDQRANLKSVFTDAKTELMGDHQKVKAAKEDLTLAILGKKDDLGALESSLSVAKAKLQQDEDAAAVKVCGLLNPKQLSAAEGLYKNMLTLRETTHKQARDYFKAARSAAGDPTSNVQGNTPNDVQGSTPDAQ
ncbi:MAG TPA: hypothetical protein VFE56_02835 [Candidatus Binataceae bacterium]|jgi:hypothetical protein|nr:hypothetical protein [Candidatus Binataceae bacterium]